MKHKRSKSSDGKLDDFGFKIDPRTPTKANSFPRANHPVLNKKGKKAMKRTGSPKIKHMVGGAQSPAIRGVGPMTVLLSGFRLDSVLSVSSSSSVSFF